MSNYRTAMGKTVDMAALAAKNEKVRAVGNIPVNARGDTIDASGKVIVPANKKVAAEYNNTVKPRMTMPQQSPQAPEAPVKSQTRSQPLVADPVVNDVFEFTKEELELEEMFDDDLEVEQIKENETKNKGQKKK